MRRPAELFFLAALTASAGCRRGGDEGTIVLYGRVEAPLVDLAPKVAGRVTAVHVREGDRVKAGDLLVSLDLGEVGLSAERDRAALRSAEERLRDFSAGSRTAEIAAAEAELSERKAARDLAGREAERQDSLLAKKVGSRRDADRARADLERAEAAVKASAERVALLREGSRRHQTEQARSDVARAQTVVKQSETVLRESEIRAPADGVVLHRIAEPGLLLSPGQAGVTLAFADRLFVRTYVPETRLGRVRVGQAATVVVDAFRDKSFPARIAEISPDAEFTPKPVETARERVNLVYAAKVDLLAGWDAPLVPGQPAEVRVDAGARPGATPETKAP